VVLYPAISIFIFEICVVLTERRLELVSLGLSVVLAGMLWANADLAIRRPSSKLGPDQLDEVARAVESKGRDRTLLAASGRGFGTTEAYLYFATRNPPANRFFFTHQVDSFQVPLAFDRDRIIADYREHPPEILAMEVWAFMLHASPLKQLALELSNSPQYRLCERVNNWVIYERIPVGN
jgi:hypothetical protein